MSLHRMPSVTVRDLTNLFDLSKLINLIYEIIGPIAQLVRAADS